MNTLIQIFDITSAILIVLSLALVTRWYKVWLLYAFASFLFTIVCVYNRIPGLSVMGVILLFVGLKNFRSERKKRRRNGKY